MASASTTVKSRRVRGSPGCHHASTSTRGSVSRSVTSAGTTTSLCDASQQALCMMWQTTSCSFARSPPMRHLWACCPCSSSWARHLAPAVPSDFCRRWCWHNPCCITGRSRRTLALIRNSISSSETHSGPSFVVSHSAFSSPPSWWRRAANSARGPVFRRCLRQWLFSSSPASFSGLCLPFGQRPSLDLGSHPPSAFLFRPATSP